MSILETKRLTLEKFELSDAKFVFELLTAPNWLENIGDRGIRTIKDAENFIKDRLLPGYSKYGFGFYKMILKSSGESIGFCGFIKRDELEFPDVGYSILPQFERHGYTWEALEATMRYGYEVLKFNTILGVTDENNIVSQYLLEKAGLHLIGKTKIAIEEEELLLYSNKE
ncbi:MAG: N-acetyltransferase [Melioribacteraceae bacterium]|nr:MAG: N-acetyltransferase [Melioribacteraceae bacterium]